MALPCLAAGGGAALGRTLSPAVPQTGAWRGADAARQSAVLTVATLPGGQRLPRQCQCAEHVRARCLPARPLGLPGVGEWAGRDEAVLCDVSLQVLVIFPNKC